MYYYIATVILAILCFIIYNRLTYYIFVREKNLLILLLCIISLLPSMYILSYRYIFNNGTIGAAKERSFVSNQKSQYSQTWLDYLSYRDGEIGRLGSEEKFESFLKDKGFTERSYALEVIKDMLKEQGVDDESIADKCVAENIKGSLE